MTNPLARLIAALEKALPAFHIGGVFVEDNNVVISLRERLDADANIISVATDLDALEQTLRRNGPAKRALRGGNG
jgi:hypothetical protein